MLMKDTEKLIKLLEKVSGEVIIVFPGRTKGRGLPPEKIVKKI